MYSYVKLDFGPTGFHYGWGYTAQANPKPCEQQNVHGWFGQKTEITTEGITTLYCAYSPQIWVGKATRSNIPTSYQYWSKFLHSVIRF